MTTEERVQMNSLCAEIQEEKKYDRFVMLLRELSTLIERKEVRFEPHPNNREWQRNRPWRTVPAIVKKLLKPVGPGQPEKVEISIATADDLFREIRIENALTSTDGQTVALEEGAHVDVTFEAGTKDTRLKRTTASLCQALRK